MALRFVSDVAIPDGNATYPSLSFSSNEDVGFFYEVTAIGVTMDGVQSAKFLPTGFETDIVACGDTTVLDELDFLGYTLDSKLKVDRTVYDDLDTGINIESASTSYLEVQNSGSLPKFGISPWYGSAAYSVQASGGTGVTTLGGAFGASFAYGTATTVTGMYGIGGAGTTGTVTNAYGGYFSATSEGSSTVTNGVGVYISNNFSSSGSYGQNIGLYVNQTNDGTLFDGSTSSNIYSVGQTSVNRFEGYVAVGNPLMTAAPVGLVDIRPGTSYDIVSLRVTGSAYATPTENIQEWYTNTPTLALAVTKDGDLKLEDSFDIQFPSVTGSKVGTASTQKIGFWGATPVARDTGWTTANVTSSLSFDADTVSLAELADIVGTLVDRLVTVGLLGA